MPTTSFQVADAKADQVAISFKWRVLLPTNATPALLADFGSALPSGTASIAANASPRVATVPITTIGNTAYQGDRFFDVEIYDVVPATAILTASKIRVKIQEDDAAPGVIGPFNLAAGETRVFETGSKTHSVRFKSPEYPFVFVDVNFDGGTNYNSVSNFANKARVLAFRSSVNNGRKPVVQNDTNTTESSMRGSQVVISGDGEGATMVGYGVTHSGTFGGFAANATKVRIRAIKAITDLYVTPGTFA